MITQKTKRRPPRGRGEYLSLLGALGVLAIAAFLGVVIWSLSPDEVESPPRAAPVVLAEAPQAMEPEPQAPTLKERVRQAVAPVIDLPAKVTNPLEFIPDWPADEEISFLFLGTDKRDDDPFAKTDTIMVLRIDPRAHAAVLVSIPRDVCLDKCDTEPYRINTVLFFEGANSLRNRVSDLVGFPIDYHVTMEFQGFVELVDFFGGVDVVVERDIYDYRYPNAADDGFDPFILRVGFHRLDGESALKYVRTRWEDPEGDFGRMDRQQDFLLSMRDQVLTPKSIMQAPAIVGHIANAFETNFPLTRMPALAKLTLRIPSAAVLVANIDYTDSRVYPAEGENGAKVLVPNVPRIHRFVADVMEEARQAGGTGDVPEYEPIVRQQLEP